MPDARAECARYCGASRRRLVAGSAAAGLQGVAVIVFDAASVVYPDQTVAVDRLSLTVPSGRITVFVGPSGCGKTTSLRLINKMILPSSGRVLIDGADIASIDAATLRRGIGYVIQQVGLFPHRSVVDNVATVPVLLGVGRRQARSAALALLERVGLDPALANRYPRQLSGGQQQRVGVARALAADPPILLMDEPFSAVDPVVRHQLQDDLLRLQADIGKTIVFVTHDIDEALRLGDEIAVMREGGHLAQLAGPAELLANPADDFVADFVGRDRGYRALGFVEGAPEIRPEATVDLGASAETARRIAAGAPWLLVLDAARRPLGWVRPERLDGAVTAGDLNRSGTLARVDGSLRALLDAALSSPSRRGVVVDAQGALVGSVSASGVLATIEAGERA
ncbi:MAG: ABC transporter ATP-binding protein [Burkholderiales bacterium]|nr:ABC transporter ATP-binding protein [Burkholderiales bacterium]